MSEEEEIGAGAFAEEDEREPIDLAVVEFLIREEMAVIERINPTWVEAIHAQRAILQSLESFANEQIAAIKKDSGERPESTVSVRNIGLAGAEMLPPRFPATERAEAERAEDEEDDQGVVEEPSDAIGQPDEGEADHYHAEGDEVH